MQEVVELPLMAQELDTAKMRSRRQELNLSQGEAAELAGFGGGAAQWSDIENGRRRNVTIDTLSRIATALKCDARDLITKRKAK